MVRQSYLITAAENCLNSGNEVTKKVRKVLSATEERHHLNPND